MNYQVSASNNGLMPTYQPTQLKAPAQLLSTAQSTTVGGRMDTFAPTAPAAAPLNQANAVRFDQAPALPYADAQPMMNVSGYVPTFTTLNLNRDQLQFATALEAKVKNEGYQPTEQELAAYNNMGQQLDMMRTNIQPLGQNPGLPMMDYNVAPVAQQQQDVPGAAANVPAGPQGQVTLSEIEWSLILEEKKQKYGIEPTPDEAAKYQNILVRFKANQKIKMELTDALAAQSPWVGANVAQIRYSKIISGSVSEIIGAVRNGTGSALAGLKNFGLASAKATGLSAVVSGGFSLVTNGIAYLQGKKTKTQLVSNVAADTLTGAATGLGATVAGGLAATALAATSIAGWPLTLLVGGAGMLGGYLADKLITKLGAKEWIRSKVIGMMEGGAKGATVAQAPAATNAGSVYQQ